MESAATHWNPCEKNEVVVDLRDGSQYGLQRPSPTKLARNALSNKRAHSPAYVDPSFQTERPRALAENPT